MRYKLSMTLILLTVLLVGQTALAQSGPDTIEMVGAVESINADGSIVVNGQTVTITTAQLNAALTVDAVVKIEGTLLNDGRIAAREVDTPDDNDLRDDEIELIGVVDSFNGTSLVIGGFTFDVTGAEFNGPVVVGQVVEVEASFADDGSLIARELDDEDDPADDDDRDAADDDRPGEFELVGTLDAIDGDTIVVNGQAIDVANAEIRNQLVTGMLVRLHLRNQNGQLIAREVQTARRNFDDDDDDGFVDDDNFNNNGNSNANANGNVNANANANGNGNFNSNANNNANTNTSGSWNVTYTVRAGDTLSSIAARAGVTIEELARMNNITDLRLVVVGTQLLVPRPLASFDDDDDDGFNNNSNFNDNFDDDDDDGFNTNTNSNNNDDDDDDGRRNNRNDDDDDDNESSGDSDDDD